MSAVAKTALEAKKTCQALSLLTTEQKNRILSAMARSLSANSVSILGENKKDVLAAYKKGLAPALVARLALDEAKIKKIAGSLLAVAALPDPVGRLLSEKKRPNGLVVRKVSVPIGVIL